MIYLHRVLATLFGSRAGPVAGRISCAWGFPAFNGDYTERAVARLT